MSKNNTKADPSQNEQDDWRDLSVNFSIKTSIL